MNTSKPPIRVVSMSFCAVLIFLLTVLSCSQIGFPIFATPTFTSTVIPIKTITPTMVSTISPEITATFSPIPTVSISITPTPTLPSEARCNYDASPVASWTTERNGFFYEAFICPDDTLIAIFGNQEIPTLIAINQNPKDSLEYVWDVYVDADAQKDTGSTDPNWTGADYVLSYSHFSNGVQTEVSFGTGFQINTWISCKYGNNMCYFESAQVIIDINARQIILIGKIPGIKTESQLLFKQFFLTDDNDLSSLTEWVNSN